MSYPSQIHPFFPLEEEEKDSLLRNRLLLLKSRFLNPGSQAFISQ